MIHAQSMECGTDQLHHQMMETNPRYAGQFNQHEALLDEILRSPKNSSSEREVIIIPVVVHVIHLGEPIGTGSNISDSQIYQALSGLNARFNNWIGAGANVDILFLLAKRDPYGCPTTGINRANGFFVEDYLENGIGPGGFFCFNNESSVKDLSRWPVLEYYNIWVVHKICGGLENGYAYFPNGSPYDGAVVIASEMTQSSYALTHEVGHGFNLYHTFEGDSYPLCPVDTNCLENGDKICDTPPHRQSDCESENPCSTEGIWDNSRYNYMSYCEPEDSVGRFTQNQKERMLASLEIFPRLYLRDSKGWLNPDTSFCKIDPFITTWNTSNPGLTSDKQIYFPGVGTNYTIRWELVSDTTIHGVKIGNNTTTITLPNPGIYRIKIIPGAGTFYQIQFNNEWDCRKLISIDQWGDISWSSMENAFFGCSNMTCMAIDTPNLFNVTNMQNMFNGCTLFDGAIGHWWTGHVSNMEGMFSNASQFNQDIGNWNTSAVTNMAGVFRGAKSFNQDIGNWNTDNVTKMDGMFYQATAFNQPIGHWNTTKVYTLREMFYDADAFNQDIGDWNTSNVNDISLMFEKANSFNQDISRWNTTKVRFMLETFRQADAFNQDIGAWNTSNVISMIQMFYDAKKFNRDLGSWKLNTNVNLLDMLVRCGMDCDNYSATLIGWQSNNLDVIDRTLDASTLKYGTNAVAARNALIQDQHWAISGDSPSGTNCEPCTITATISPTHTTCGLNNGQLVIDAIGGDQLSYTWNTGDTTAILTYLAPGTFTVTISAQNGCTLVQSSSIEASQALALELIFEEPHLIALTEGGKEPLHYLWNSGDTTSVIEPQMGGEYTVTVTDADSCQITGSFHVLFSSLGTLNSSIRIYPNPVRYNLFVEIPPYLTYIDATLYDMNGRAIWNGSIQRLGELGLNVAELPQGVYVLKIMEQNKSLIALINKL